MMVNQTPGIAASLVALAGLLASPVQACMIKGIKMGKQSELSYVFRTVQLGNRKPVKCKPLGHTGGSIYSSCGNFVYGESYGIIHVEDANGVVVTAAGRAKFSKETTKCEYDARQKLIFETKSWTTKGILETGDKFSVKTDHRFFYEALKPSF